MPSALKGLSTPTLALVFALLPSEPLAAQEYEETHKCDELAAHPNDPNRWAAGVPDEEIIPGPAVKFCREAVKEYPDTPRFAFQLGRAMWAANRIDEGTEVFRKLEEDFEYGPVYAYLGDAYMYGIGGVEADEELAVSLYEIAAEEGFSPAEDVLAALAGGGEDSGGQTAAAAPEAATGPQSTSALHEMASIQPPTVGPELDFDPAQYTQARIIGALYSGNFADMEADGVGKTNYAGLSNSYLYVQAFHKKFSAQVNLLDQACVTLYKPSVQLQLDAKLRNIVTGGAGNLETSLNRGSEQGWKMFADLLTDLESGGMDMVMQTQQNLQALAESGGIDAARLISVYGCQSETAQRIYTNIEAYAFGRPGILSPEEEARQSQKRDEEARLAEQARQLALRDGAQSSCMNQWDKDSMCGCMVSALDQSEITEAEWRVIGSDFKKVTSVAKDHDGLSDIIRACLKK